MKQNLLHSKLNSLSIEELENLDKIPKYVSFRKETGLWRATLFQNGKTKHILSSKNLQKVIKALEHEKSKQKVVRSPK